MSQFLHESLLRDVAKLKDKTITLAGCGALGSWTAEYLARAGADNFRLIDKDRVEAHNLGSQFHYKQQLGATKVKSLGQHLYRFHGARVELHPIELNTSNALSLLMGSDVILCTFDNYKSRQILQDICLEGDFPCVFGGMNGNHWYGHVEWAENYDNPPDPAHYAIDPCFIAGANVQTNDGVRSIEGITEGQHVLTENLEGVVQEKMTRTYTGDLINIDGMGFEAFECTPSHPFLAIKRGMCSISHHTILKCPVKGCSRQRRGSKCDEIYEKYLPTWIEARDLEKGDYLLYPVDHRVSELNEYTFRYDYWDQSIQRTLPFTIDIFDLMGFYLAEGWAPSKHRTIFSFNEKEINLVNEVNEIIQRQFGKKGRIEPQKGKHAVRLIINSKEITTFLSPCGNGAANKTIPPFAFHAPHALLKRLIWKFFQGDGSYVDNEKRFDFSTSSPHLAYQLRDVLLRFGVCSGFWAFGPYIDKTGLHHSRHYRLNVCGRHAKKLASFLNHSDEEFSSRSYIHCDELYGYYPLKTPSRRAVSNIEVHNLKTNDGTYVVNGVIAHNCAYPLSISLVTITSAYLYEAAVRYFIFDEKRGARIPLLEPMRART